ncbi:hypothetical protein HPP92_017403 [Vanilla planifolia]|uniref:Pentatricopeptide repeat-containing protein n=1 Tax=Vanilla planifolia TaxID=51239 RepID=A0A835QCA9_VANPL|nr:hypothetical protein HPP92_017403 [Vanilla planifolia]
MQSSKKHWICFLARKSLFKLIDCFSTACHSVDSATYTGLLQSFTYSNSLNLGKSIHAHMIRNDFRQNVFLQNNLLNMYCKCGDISHAQHLFDGMIKKDVVSWNALVSGCFQFGFFEKALSVFICARKAQVSLDPSLMPVL